MGCIAKGVGRKTYRWVFHISHLYQSSLECTYMWLCIARIRSFFRSVRYVVSLLTASTLLKWQSRIYQLKWPSPGHRVSLSGTSLTDLLSPRIFWPNCVSKCMNAFGGCFVWFVSFLEKLILVVLVQDNAWTSCVHSFLCVGVARKGNIERSHLGTRIYRHNMTKRLLWLLSWKPVLVTC